MCQKLSGILLLLVFASSLVSAQQVSVPLSQLRALEAILQQLKLEVSNWKEQSAKQAELLKAYESSLELKEKIITDYESSLVKKEKLLSDSEQSLTTKENSIRDLQIQLAQATGQSGELTISLDRANQSLKDLSKQHLRNILLTGGICLGVGMIGGIALTLYVLPLLTR
jgi:chromosome segregation ATPase